MEHYNTLGVSKSASKQDIKKAYRKLAGKHHPDKGGDAEQFKKITEAYEILHDDNKRQMYDQYGTADPQQMGGNPFGQGDPFGNAGFEDVFGSIFGGGFRQQRRQANQNITIGVNLTLQEAFKGKSLIAAYRLQTGREEKVDITLPPGAKNGDTVRYQGLGDDSFGQLPRGDLHVRIQVANDRTWRREGDNLYCQKDINFFDLLLGCVIIITTIDNKQLSVNVPAGTNIGTTFSIQSYGMPNVNNPRVRGNAYITVNSVTPNITDPQTLMQIQKIRDTYGQNTETN